MNEKTLMIMSYSFTIAGIILLFFLQQSLTLPQTQISDLSDISDDKYVRLKAEIKAIRDFDNYTIIQLSQTSTVDVFIFKNNFPLKFAQVMNFSSGDIIEIKGRKGQYLEKPQIIAEKIIKI